MFRASTQGAHNSEDVSAATNSGGSSSTSFCKLLITRRSWLANATWAKFPRPAIQKSYAIPLDEKESPPAAWIGGDYVDAGLPLHGTTEVIRTVYAPVTEAQVYAEADTDNKAALLEFLKVHGYRPYQLIFFLFSILTYLADIGSDIYLVYSYHRQGDYYWSYLTLMLFLVPAFVMTTFSLVWYVLDRRLNVDPPRPCHVWALRLIFHGLQLAPLVRLTDAIYYGLVSRRPDLSLAMAVHYTQLMLYEDADSAMLRMIESFMEAAPQLLLQLYILLTQETPEHKFQFFAQIVACSTSWLSLAWALTHYQTALRRSRVEKANMTWLGSFLFFCWKTFMLFSRILSLAFFAAVVRGLWFSLGLGAHWLLCVGWLVTHGTKFCSPNPCTFTEILFDIVLGAVYCFDVVNIREGHSRLWYSMCYTVIGLENLLATFLWSVNSSSEVAEFFTFSPLRLMRPPNLSSWIRKVPWWVLPVCAIGSFFLGLLIMLIYYVFAHPSKNIKIWVPCDELFAGTETSAIQSVTPMGRKYSESTEPVEDTACV